ncbi:hypothetical protein VIBHAR_01459 [Vibrio campbellii ATCC BAA-1116]|uniref:Integrase catalytic domain-containing protein n=1 Tax=Vibrio campbellii (strain ATCC BAA-1116) TaxID=2902295 RepID=A7MV63_VIBC1|nr:hypothetical protein VIBHAR_01459 [Vibrio campbellii ATCC BAA-1116]
MSFSHFKSPHGWRLDLILRARRLECGFYGALTKAYTTPREAELEIGHYMVFYNEERNHQGLNDLTPDEAYFGRQRYAA